MPAYSFEALTAEGSTRKGIIEADTARAARSMLRAQALVPLAVEPVGASAKAGQQAAGSGWNTTLWSKRVFNATALAIWTRQIAGLVTSGLPLERALTALADEAENDTPAPPGRQRCAPKSTAAPPLPWRWRSTRASSRPPTAP